MVVDEYLANGGFMNQDLETLTRETVCVDRV